MDLQPDFLGLGAERAGTSWIYACLYEHPGICAPEKEMHFFSRERYWRKGFEWYESRFESCNPDQRVGEFSTSYLHHPEAPRRIHEWYPSVKLIVSLRNPVERALSSFRNEVVAGDITAASTFEEALEQRSRYLEIGRYASHLERYLKLFSRDQILVLVYENARDDPAGFIRRIYDFLGVESGFEPSMLKRTVNPGREPRVPGFAGLLNRVSRTFRSSTLLRPVWWLTKRSGLGTLLRQLNTAPGSDRMLSPQTRRDLYRTFRPEIERLEEMLGVSLEHWRPGASGDRS